MINKYISVPKALNINCASFVAGVVKGALDAAEFVRNLGDGMGWDGMGCGLSKTKTKNKQPPARVHAYPQKDEDKEKLKGTVYIIIEFSPAVIEREKKLSQ